jgi:hypothetical protein
MKQHTYDNAPAAGWSGYTEGPDWVLFIADDGSTFLHRR